MTTEIIQVTMSPQPTHDQKLFDRACDAWENNRHREDAFAEAEESFNAVRRAYGKIGCSRMAFAGSLTPQQEKNAARYDEITEDWQLRDKDKFVFVAQVLGLRFMTAEDEKSARIEKYWAIRTANADKHFNLSALERRILSWYDEKFANSVL